MDTYLGLLHLGLRVQSLASYNSKRCLRRPILAVSKDYWLLLRTIYTNDDTHSSPQVHKNYVEKGPDSDFILYIFWRRFRRRLALDQGQGETKDFKIYFRGASRPRTCPPGFHHRKLMWKTLRKFNRSYMIIGLLFCTPITAKLSFIPH